MHHIQIPDDYFQLQSRTRDTPVAPDPTRPDACIDGLVLSTWLPRAVVCSSVDVRVNPCDVEHAEENGAVSTQGCIVHVQSHLSGRRPGNRR
jgi:hypothetical protein